MKLNIKHFMLVFGVTCLGMYSFGTNTCSGNGILSDTIKRIQPDDYPITDRMLGSDKNQNGREIKAGKLRSLDKVWFRNDSLGQTIVIELETDLFRGGFYHFLNNDIPRALINDMELNTPDGDTADITLKVKNFHTLIKSGRPLADKYFKSIKGFKPGDKKEKALKVYGKPDAKSVAGNVERYEWNYVGDNGYDGKENLHGKPLAAGSFGYHVIIYFRNNQMIGMVLKNDIP